MLKYVNTGIVFQEIPDETTLAINISNCPCACPGCHSHYLWEDVGLPLNTDAIDDFVRKYGSDITCIAFMGEMPNHKGSTNSPFISTRLTRNSRWHGTADVFVSPPLSVRPTLIISRSVLLSSIWDR